MEKGVSVKNTRVLTPRLEKQPVLTLVTSVFKRSLGADHSSALTLYKILPLYKALQWECHYVKAEKVNSVRISASCHNRSTLILFMKHIHFSLISRNPQTFSLLSLYVLYRYDADCISLFGFVTKTSFNVMG